MKVVIDCARELVIFVVHVDEAFELGLFKSLKLSKVCVQFYVMLLFYPLNSLQFSSPEEIFVNAAPKINQRQFSILEFPIRHFVCPSKKTMVYAKFGGQTKCSMRNAKIENWFLISQTSI